MLKFIFYIKKAGNQLRLPAKNKYTKNKEWLSFYKDTIFLSITKNILINTYNIDALKQSLLQYVISLFIKAPHSEHSNSFSSK